VVKLCSYKTSASRQERQAMVARPKKQGSLLTTAIDVTMILKMYDIYIFLKTYNRISPLGTLQVPFN